MKFVDDDDDDDEVTKCVHGLSIAFSVNSQDTPVTVIHVDNSMAFQKVAWLLYRNSADAVKCFESIKCEKNTSTYYELTTSFGLADGNAYLCTDSEMRKGKILLRLSLFLKYLQW